MVKFAAIAMVLAISSTGFAATGEMGTGIPQFGSYGEATSVRANVWSLTDATIPFPAECGYIVLSQVTMGATSYRIAIATLLAAKVAGRKVRFYAHEPRDGGCGVDYVELL